MADDWTLETIDLGRVRYREADALQREHHAEVVAGRDQSPAPQRLLLLEHDPAVITVSKRAGADTNLLASPEHLASIGVDLERTDRGGDITWHGPGQLVAWPIVDLNRFGLGLHAWMRLMEQAVIDTLAEFGIEGFRDDEATGVWVKDDRDPRGAKICAMGVRVSKWVTLHGLALNVHPDLSQFGLIVPCGLLDRPVTSLKHAGVEVEMNQVQELLKNQFSQLLSWRDQA